MKVSITEKTIVEIANQFHHIKITKEEANDILKRYKYSIKAEMRNAGVVKIYYIIQDIYK